MIRPTPGSDANDKLPHQEDCWSAAHYFMRQGARAAFVDATYPGAPVRPDVLVFPEATDEVWAVEVKRTRSDIASVRSLAQAEGYRTFASRCWLVAPEDVLTGVARRGRRSEQLTQSILRRVDQLGYRDFGVLMLFRAFGSTATPSRVVLREPVRLRGVDTSESFNLAVRNLCVRLCKAGAP